MILERLADLILKHRESVKFDHDPEGSNQGREREGKPCLSDKLGMRLNYRLVETGARRLQRINTVSFYPPFFIIHVGFEIEVKNLRFLGHQTIICKP